MPYRHACLHETTLVRHFPKDAVCASSRSQKSIEELAKWGGRPRPRPTPPSASVLSELEEPDHGSGADEGVRPTTKYVADHWDMRLAACGRSSSQTPLTHARVSKRSFPTSTTGC